MVEFNGGSVYMGVDHTNVASSAGRNSVRITSNKSYQHGLFILDLTHMRKSRLFLMFLTPLTLFQLRDVALGLLSGKSVRS